jgi:hypothetical protein
MFIVLVTFVLAIAMEKLVDQLVLISDDSGSPSLVSCYLVGASLFLGMLMTWLATSQMFTLLVPVPHPTQAFVPFVLGLFQFTAIAFLTPETLGWALVAAGGTHVTAGFVMFHGFKYVRTNPENRRVTEGFARSSVVVFFVALGLVQLVAAGALDTVVLTSLLVLALGFQLALVATWSISWWRLIQREAAVDDH